MIDIHCHILPRLDDGAFSLDESVLMAEGAFECGTRGIVCTPHSGPYSAQELVSAFVELKNTLRSLAIPIELYLGQEIYLTENYAMQIRDIANGYPITINGTDYALVEFIPDAHSRIIRDSVDLLVAEGITPIIAHPERYAAITEDLYLADRLKASGALLQLNKGSLRGAFGHYAKQTASYLLDERMADFVASDAHSPYERTTKMRDAHAYISERYSIDYADYLMQNNPAQVIAGSKIIPCNF
jgi:protein-tyrosine phosphatase